MEEQAARIKPGTVFASIGIVLGIIVAVVILAAIAYYVLKFTFPNYLDVVNNLYLGATKPVQTLSSPITGFFSKLKSSACGAEKIVTQSK